MGNQSNKFHAFILLVLPLAKLKLVKEYLWK